MSESPTERLAAVPADPAGARRAALGIAAVCGAPTGMLTFLDRPEEEYLRFVDALDALGLLPSKADRQTGVSGVGDYETWHLGDQLADVAVLSPWGCTPLCDRQDIAERRRQQAELAEAAHAGADAVLPDYWNSTRRSVTYRAGL